jgi:2-dehydro-3-deoxy-D-arabinonate dehydratase
MRLAKVRLSDGTKLIAKVEQDKFLRLDLTQVENVHSLSDILHSPDPVGLAKFLIDTDRDPLTGTDVKLLAPIDRQEVWAAGVTYKRSQVARMEESETGASHYDRVYTAPRPELFFKATPSRVSGPGDPVRVRYDSQWSVPEPELTLVASPEKKLVGFTIGNDMSARDIEGENPLYLPQAKFYNQGAALGPCILIPEEPFDKDGTKIVLTIKRNMETVFTGETGTDQIVRDFDELIGWLGRENDFPDGVMLMTGTGIVPEDDFSLEDGDDVSIEITGIGTLVNPVVKAKVD